MLQQSQALMALVASLHHGDPLLDIHASASGTSSRGAQSREKLQRELAARSGNFFLLVMQNMFKKVKPALPVPQTLEAMAETDISALTYLERFGSFANAKDMGIAMYGLSFVVDAALRGDMAGVREHLALLMVGMEQYSQDTRWDLGFLLTLLEDPPSTMFTYRNQMSAQTGRNRAFAPLCPQRWATVALAYLKEMDFIQNRRADTQKKEQPSQPSLTSAPKPKPKPKYFKGKQQTPSPSADPQDAV
eukprot:s1163_g1.t1